MNPDELPTALGVWRLAIAFSERLARELAPLGVTTAEFRLIGEVLRFPDGVRQGTLAQRLGVRPPTVSAAVSRMERAGLLRRQPDPDDPRAKLIFIAPDAPLDAGMSVLAKIESDLTAGLGQAQQHTLQDTLRRLALATGSEL